MNRFDNMSKDAMARVEEIMNSTKLNEFLHRKEEEEKKLRKAEQEAGYDDGKKLGITEGEIRKAKETAIELTKVGMAKSQIAAILKVNENMLRQWLEK